MTFFIFRRLAIGNRNSGTKQTLGSKSYEKLREGFKALSLPTHSDTKFRVRVIGVWSTGK